MEKLTMESFDSNHDEAELYICRALQEYFKKNPNSEPFLDETNTLYFLQSKLEAKFGCSVPLSIVIAKKLRLELWGLNIAAKLHECSDSQAKEQCRAEISRTKTITKEQVIFLESMGNTINALLNNPSSTTSSFPPPLQQGFFSLEKDKDAIALDFPQILTGIQDTHRLQAMEVRQLEMRIAKLQEGNKRIKTMCANILLSLESTQQPLQQEVSLSPVVVEDDAEEFARFTSVIDKAF